MELRDKVKAALEGALEPQLVDLQDDDGIIGCVVSSRFRRMEAIDRQFLIDDILKEPAAGLEPAERKKVILISAFTPEEYGVHDRAKEKPLPHKPRGPRRNGR